MNIRPQSEFPLIEEYAKHFKITENTIFAYDNAIYTNNDLPHHLIVHEETHLKQQERDGLDFWVNNYLKNEGYRLLQEIEAYKAQLASIPDRNARNLVRLESARNLSSALYANIISYEKALEMLK